MEGELPDELRKGLKLEKLKRKESKFWVRIPEPLPIPQTNLQALLSRALGKECVKMERDNGGFIVDCASQEGREALLVMDNWQLGDSSLKVMVYELLMTLQEMFKWVANHIDFLESEEPYKPRGIHQTTQNESPERAHTTSPRPSRPVYHDTRAYAPPTQQTWTNPHNGKGSSPTKFTQKGKGKGFVRNKQPDKVYGKGVSASLPTHEGSGGRGRGQGRDQTKCWSCQALGRPDNHYYRECPVWLAQMTEKAQRYRANTHTNTPPSAQTNTTQNNSNSNPNNKKPKQA